MAQIEDEEVVLFNAHVLYREWGRRFTVLQQFLKAVEFYKESATYNENPKDNLTTLLGLSEALMKSGQFKEAAEVAEQCMKIDPKHLGANWTRMEALFKVAEFCRSLVYAYQGVRYRRHFRFQVLLANETIEDCVGVNVTPGILRHIQPWIARLTEHRDKLLEKLKEMEDEFEGIGEEQTKFKVSDPEAKLRKYQVEHDRRMSLRYLKGTGQQKRYLEDLLQRPALKSANKAGSKLLTETIKDLIHSTQSQQEALRTRRPLYAIRAMYNAAITPGRRFILRQELELRRCLVRQEAVYLLRQLHVARIRRDYPLFFKMVELVKDRFESCGSQLLPERRKYLEALYRMVARAYIDPRNLQRFYNQPEKVAINHMRLLLGLRSGKLPRDSDLAWIPSLDIKRSLNICRERLALTNNSLEVLWLFHELCKLFLQLKRYDLARFYAKKMRDLSEHSGNEDWAVNASHILVRVELYQHNRNEAREAALAALESAQKLSVGFLVDFYERVISYIDKIEFDRGGGNDSIIARERQILCIMPLQMRPKMNLLLRSIAAVTVQRRLSIMPGCSAKDEPGKSMKKTAAPQVPRHYEKDIRDRLLKRFSPNTKTLGVPHLDEFV